MDKYKARHIFKTNKAAEFPTGERCHIIEILSQSANKPFSIARARVEPGVTTQLHALEGIDEAYYILSGKAQVEIDGLSQGILNEGDIVSIPKNLSQRVTNIGENDLIFLCICSPPFEESKYRNLE